MKPLSIILIACLGIIIYSNTFHAPFQFDDKVFITNNTTLRNIGHWQDIWSYMPCRFITFLSLALNYHCHQLDVFGYHMVNLIIHLAAAILVWWLTLLTFSTPILKKQDIVRSAEIMALLIALVFVSHPLQTEGVTYIWQRCTSLAALFYLASLCCYVKARLMNSHSGKINFIEIAASPSAPRNDVILYSSSLSFAIMAMFTKENTITLPLMILLYEYFFFKTERNFNWKYAGPFLLTVCIIPLTMFLTASTSDSRVAAPTEPGNISSMHYFLTQLRAMVTYIRLAFLPFNQNVDYDYPILRNILAPPVLLGLTFLAAIFYCAKRLFQKYRIISFSILWFFITLLPESSFFPLKDVIFEHRLYLPLVGYSLFLASSVYYLLRDKNLSAIVKILIAVIACYAVMTYQRNKVWQSEFTLWNDAIQKSPHKERPYNNCGLILAQQGHLKEAIADYSKAIEINPRYINAYVNRGLLYSQQGEYRQAISDDDKAIELNPQLAEAYINRANVYFKEAQLNQAEADYTQAVTLKPALRDAYYNLGFIDSKQGHFLQAVFCYSQVIKLNPKDIEAYTNRAICFFKLNEFDKSWDDVHRIEALGGAVSPPLISALKQVTQTTVIPAKASPHTGHSQELGIHKIQ